MENLKEQIKMLVELQGIDTRIFKLDDDLAVIPETIKNKEAEFKAKDAGLKKLEDELKALQVKRKEKEGELAAKEGNIKKFQQQLNLVKTNKEYSALQEEIGRAKADNSIIEEDILKIFDEVDAENKRIAQEKEFLKSEEAKFAEEKKKLLGEEERIKAELQGIKAQRETLAAKIDKNILKKYDRIIKSKDGLAVVTIANEACQGCFRILPPQVTNEIKMNKDLVFCDNCARILYIEE
ncbi:MAG: C4-type zinc ribbon domain-containing protein [Candidatus Omnitrophica bacterium]|nr:C4-type zinc ribbon domain-containing protein [Candidatus Omnitrophota bacterium]